MPLATKLGIFNVNLCHNGKNCVHTGNLIFKHISLYFLIFNSLHQVYKKYMHFVSEMRPNFGPMDIVELALYLYSVIHILHLLVNIGCL